MKVTQVLLLLLLVLLLVLLLLLLLLLHLLLLLLILLLFSYRSYSRFAPGSTPAFVPNFSFKAEDVYTLTNSSRRTIPRPSTFNAILSS